MKIQQSVSLAPYTSFKVGGPAENLIEIDSENDLIDFVTNHHFTPVWLLGYGSNSLISDKGLPGLTIVQKGGSITVEDNVIVADAGVWWDDIVKEAIDSNLWGIELMSEIPGSFGAALFINITAYGQSIGPRLLWIDAWDQTAGKVRRLEHQELSWDYKHSMFQEAGLQHLVIIKAALRLEHQKSDEVTYQKALDVADQKKLDLDSLSGRRECIVEARARAGSLWRPGDESAHNTAGSFFRNPVVSPESVERIIAHDESGTSATQIKKMNLAHGGNEQRVSAAHVMLAAGFQRGQTWGNVKLNEQNLLKIEALPGATAQNVYDVAREIQATCKTKLDIDLEAEVRILGDFS